MYLYVAIVKAFTISLLMSERIVHINIILFCITEQGYIHVRILKFVLLAGFHFERFDV